MENKGKEKRIRRGKKKSTDLSKSPLSETLETDLMTRYRVRIRGIGFGSGTDETIAAEGGRDVRNEVAFVEGFRRRREGKAMAASGFLSCFLSLFCLCGDGEWS